MFRLLVGGYNPPSKTMKHSAARQVMLMFAYVNGDDRMRALCVSAASQSM